MKILFKKNSIIFFFLFIVVTLKGQVFSLVDSLPTNISEITYDSHPVHSEKGFYLLFYPIKEKKGDFELLTLKDTEIHKIQLKNPKLDGGGAWIQSVAISDNQLVLYHVDGIIVLYQKNKKGNYVLKEKINIGTQIKESSIISFLDSENIILMNDYNYYTEKKLYDNYAICIYNLKSKKVVHQIELDLGKGILLSHYGLGSSIESKKDKIAVAHPTLPYIYIFNDNLNPIDTIHAQFQDKISVDSVVYAIFTDSFIEDNRFNPKGIIKTIEDKKIDQMERIEKVFWLNDDIVGYTIRHPFSKARIFVFYSIKEKREIARQIEFYAANSVAPKNFIYTPRILINNNKTIDFNTVYDKDKNDFFFYILLYDILPANGTK